MLSPKKFSLGLLSFKRALHWLRRHPRYAFYLSLPIIGSFFLMITSVGYLWQYRADLNAWIIPDFGEAWWGVTLEYLASGMLFISAGLLGLLGSVLLMNVIACPIYDLVSIAVEKDMRGGVADELSFWQGIRLISEEIKKLAFIMIMSLVLLFIPGLNVLVALAAAFLVGWDVFDYPLARRGWTFSRRLRFGFKNLDRVTGMGLWLLIPFVQFIILPLMVVSGTMLCMDALSESRLINSEEGSYHATKQTNS